MFDQNEDDEISTQPQPNQSQYKLEKKQSIHQLVQRSIKRKNTLRIDSQLENLTLFRPDYGGPSSHTNLQNKKLLELMNQYMPIDIESIQKSIVHHVEYTLAKNRFTFKNDHCYQAVAHSLRDRLLESFNDTNQYIYYKKAKRIYYLSIEFLIGRWLRNTIINLKIDNQYKDALNELGYALEDLYEEEVDPALGNGGLGRLAACFLDSLATLDFPAWGYGLRYNYGIFKQKIVDGYQVEIPDYWLSKGNPWEIERADVIYLVRFYGTVRTEWEQILKQLNYLIQLIREGKERYIWENGSVVLAQAYDNPMPGYNTFNSINLRLFKSIPINDFDFSIFNTGDYYKAIEERQNAEYLTSVLYPNDNTMQGKELRLKQQYFFVCSTLQDIVRRFKKMNNWAWKDFPNYVAIQLNDTHPALAIVELLRILIDQEQIDREQAFDIIYQSFAYTNHTVLPEALETWPIDLMQKLLPRHMQLIYLINHFWMQRVSIKYPGNFQKMAILSIIEESNPKRIRMANLCVIGSHVVNGVAEIHSQLLQQRLFKDFYEMNPKKFQNKTNGVTPRRWIKCCNPYLASIYDKYIAKEWLLNLTEIEVLENQANDVQLQNQWMEMKKTCKKLLIKWVLKNCQIKIIEDSIFDIQVKRFHEYKRQLMNAFYMIHHYLEIKETPKKIRGQKFIPRVSFVGGKAAPGYATAKKVIKLLNCISTVVNGDPEIGNLYKVVFLPNYNVSNAEIIIPASDISQHISTAGTEASGTSNMKFVMNGGIILGTYDGANIEIAEEVGEENMFIFGAKVEEIDELRKKMIKTPPQNYIPQQLKKVFDSIDQGTFGNIQELKQVVDTVRNNNDFYLVCHDFCQYLQAQNLVDKAYQDQEKWVKMSILNAVRSAKFSSDRTILEYANDIWNAKQIHVPVPKSTQAQLSQNKK